MLKLKRQYFGVWMWDLDYKESWAPKNWCFWIVVLEKTFETPLDWKDINPINPKGNQSWIFFGRTDAKAETPILWPPYVKSWLIGEDTDAGKDQRQAHGLQHARRPCPSPSLGACSNSCVLRWWYHPTISSSVIPFSSCLQSFPTSRYFLMIQLFTSSSQSTGVSISASVLPMNIQD